MEKTIGFCHGALSESYEGQARRQGYTFGEDAEWVQDVGYGLVVAHIHGCITDREFDKILQRFQTKILAKYVKPLESEEETIFEQDKQELFDYIKSQHKGRK